ncbi:MAG: hypothetical protein RLP44_29400 [Aggregatilineales bacterium]
MLSELEAKWSMIEGTHGMRNGVIEKLTDAELNFTPGGNALTLGELCKEMGETERAYTDSIKNYTQNFDYKHADTSVATDLKKLQGWYETLDEEMKAALESVSEDGLKKMIDRGGFEVPIDVQMDIYLQALLIFLGKATVYLRAMGKPLPEQIAQWIG